MSVSSVQQDNSHTEQQAPGARAAAYRVRRAASAHAVFQGRVHARRAAQGKSFGARRVRKAGKTGQWYVAVHAHARRFMRPYTRSTRCLLHVAPEIKPPVKHAVHKSMVGNKSKNTKPELLLRRALREAGITGYRLQWKVPGRPDVAFPGKRVAVFVNGCFWHRCPHCNPSMPKTRREYWVPKFKRNVERDARNKRLLEDAGWSVHVVWECELKKNVRDQTLARLIDALKTDLGCL